MGEGFKPEKILPKKPEAAENKEGKDLAPSNLSESIKNNIAETDKILARLREKKSGDERAADRIAAARKRAEFIEKTKNK